MESVPAGVWVALAGVIGGAVVASVTWALRKMQENPGDVQSFLGSVMTRIATVETKLDLMQAENTRLNVTNSEQLATLVSQVKEIASLSAQVTALNQRVAELGAEIKVLIALLSHTQTQVAEQTVAAAAAAAAAAVPTTQPTKVELGTLVDSASMVIPAKHETEG